MTTVRSQHDENEELGDEKERQLSDGVKRPQKSRESLVAADGTASSNSDLSAHVDENEQDQELQEKKADVPPNGGYGWVCVACVATINA
jgi:hypothetical protein